MSNSNVYQIKKSVDVNFTQIPNSMLSDNKLSWKAKGVYAYLLLKTDGHSFTKIESISRCESTRVLKNGIKELTARGYLKRVPNRNQFGQIHGWEWEFVNLPLKLKIL